MVNGQHFSGTSYQLDGTDNRDPILGIIVINPTLESIGETKITSQNYDAEFGQAAAGVVSVQTKSGANTFHGSAFEFYQSDAFQSRNPFTQAQRNALTGKFLPDTKKNQFGGSLGGPIVENKLFFFGDYQGTRNNDGGSRLLTVPTAAARARRSQRLRRQHLRSADRRARRHRTQFAGNVIPTGRLSPQAQAILALIPLPNAAGTRQRHARQLRRVQLGDVQRGLVQRPRSTAGSATGTNTFGRYSLGKFLRDGPTAFGPGGGRELVSLGGVSDVQEPEPRRTASTTRSRRSLLADFRFGFFRYKRQRAAVRLRHDAGHRCRHSRPEPGQHASPRDCRPASSIATATAGFNFGSGLDVNRCNCPLEQDE